MLTRKVMIIDDDEFTRHVLSRFLLGEGFTWVETIGDSREAISAIAHSKPDLILLDLMMPHLNGLELLKRLSKEELLTETAVIMLTAMEDDLARKRALIFGATDFLTKPVSPEDLAKRVKEVLTREKSSTVNA